MAEVKLILNDIEVENSSETSDEWSLGIAVNGDKRYWNNNDVNSGTTYTEGVYQEWDLKEFGQQSIHVSTDGTEHDHSFWDPDDSLPSTGIDINPLSAPDWETSKSGSAELHADNNEFSYTLHFDFTVV